MNRIITLVVGLYFIAFNPLAEAQTLPTYTFTASSQTPAVGEDFTIDVNVENFQNLLGFQFLITFDESVIVPQTAPMSVSVPFTNTAPELIIVQGSYISGQGIRTSWNSLTGAPVSINPATPTSRIFTIPFTVVGTNDNATFVGIDCIDFNCEIIGQNGMTGMTEVIAPSIDLGGDPFVIDIGGTGSIPTGGGGGSGTATCSDGIQNGDETGVDCGGATCPPCNTGGGGVTSPPTIIASNPGGPTTSVLCMDISVEDFDDLQGLQYTMHWNPALFSYSDSLTVSLSDLSAGNFNEVTPGTMTFSWNAVSNNAAGVTVPDGTVIYQVCFDVLGAGGSVSDFTFDGMPTSAEATAEGMTPTNNLMFTNGTLTVTGTGGGVNSITLTAGSANADPGSNVCIPVTAGSFDDIVAFQYSMNWDPSILDLTSTQNYNTSLIGLNPANFNEVTPGNLAVSWNNPSGSGLTVPDGTVLYEMCFDVIGSAGQTGTVSFSGTPSTVVIVEQVGNMAPSDEVIFSSNNGDITLTNAGGFNLLVSDVVACPDDAMVCVPFVVTGFNQIAAAQWTVEYDNTVLDFDQTSAASVQNVPSSVTYPPFVTLTNNSFNETAPGAVRFVWDDFTVQGITLPDNTTLYEMCFSIIGDLNDVSGIAITDSETGFGITAIQNGTAVIIPSVASDGSADLSCTAAGPVIDATASTTMDANCGGDGTINVVFSGGTAPITFAWDNSTETTQNLAGLDPGTYTITITDSTGATASEAFTVGGNPPLTASAMATNETASAASDGTITVTVTNGTTPYTFAWDNSTETTQNLTGLAPGMYTVTVTDANNCTTTATATVGTVLTISPVGTTAGTSMVTDVRCFDGTTGAIDLVFGGGQSPFTFAWDNGAGTTEDLANLAAGTYCVTVTDANSNTADACFTVGQPAEALAITLVSITPPTVLGDSDGAIDITATGGTPRPAGADAPYFYTWAGIGTTEDITGQPAGTYMLTVVDANQCSATATYVIPDGQEPFTIDFTNTVIANVSCNGECSGGINLALSGGQGPSTFVWSPNVGSTSNVGGLCAGSYSVTVTDANTSMATGNFTITEPTAIVVSGTTTIPTTASNGAIDLSVSGGSPAYTYLWSSGQTTQDLTGLAPGTYTVTVTDANACAVTSETFTLTVPLVVDMTATTITDASCFGGNDGSISLVVDGGITPFTYNWSDNATGAVNSDLTAGNYGVTVTDAAGTTATQSIIVGQAPEITITCTPIPESTNGGDGGINLTVSGGTAPYTYNWRTLSGIDVADTEDLSGLTSGTFLIEITDANGCTITEECTVAQNFGISASTITDVDCFGNETGTITITTAGGTPPYTWIWEDTNNNVVSTTQDLTNQAAGTYTVSIRDANGIDYSQTFEIGQPDAALDISNVVIINQIAPNLGSINITITGGTPPYSYQWSNGNTNEDIGGLVAGCYSVTITDANGCIVTSPDYCLDYTPTAISIFGDMASEPDCNGAANGTIDLIINGGDGPYDIAWSPTGAFQAATDAPVAYTITNLAAATYVITITDANGQVEERTIEVTEPDAITINPAVANITDCPGNGMINLNGNATQGGLAPYTYQWSGPNGFTASTPSIGNISDPGEYYVTITDANNCVLPSNEPINLTIDVAPLTATTGAGTVLSVACQDDAVGAINQIVTGGFCAPSFLWNNGETTEDISELLPGIYVCTIQDDAGTEIIQSYTIGTNSDINIINAFTTSDDADGYAISTAGACDGTASIVVNSSIGLTIEWCNGQTGPNASNLCEGECAILVMDTNGCELSTILNLVANPDPEILPLAVNPRIVSAPCEEECTGAITLDINGGRIPYTISWQPLVGNVANLDNLCPGDYAYTVVDNIGEVVTGSVTLDPIQLALTFEMELPTGVANEDGAITVNVAGGSGQYIYQWNDANQTNSATISALNPGTHWVIVIDEINGCEITGSAVLRDESEECFNARNIITPNQDGYNDNFVITCLNEFQTNKLEIYNRWGQLVREFTDYQNEWIGQNRRGIDLPAGAYFYVLTGTLLDGSPKKIEDHVTILRDE